MAEEPARGPLQQDPPPEEHGDLCLRRDASVERLDLRPQAGQVEDLARHGESARDVPANPATPANVPSDTTAA